MVFKPFAYENKQLKIIQNISSLYFVITCGYTRSVNTVSTSKRIHTAATRGLNMTVFSMLHATETRDIRVGKATTKDQCETRHTNSMFIPIN